MPGVPIGSAGIRRPPTRHHFLPRKSAPWCSTTASARAAAMCGADRSRRAADGGARPCVARPGRGVASDGAKRDAGARRGAVARAHHVASCGASTRCLAHRPAWLVRPPEAVPSDVLLPTGLHARSVRERSIDAVCRDFASLAATSSSPTICSGTIRHGAWSLAREFGAATWQKQWILVQAVDLVARHPELLEAWRPFARDFDIFFGLEAATDEGLDGLMRIDRRRNRARDRSRASLQVRSHRQLRHRSGLDRTTSSAFGPSWIGTAFQAGFTILTPLPVTYVFDHMRNTLRARRWSQFDMHHLLGSRRSDLIVSSSGTARPGDGRC